MAEAMDQAEPPGCWWPGLHRQGDPHRLRVHSACLREQVEGRSLDSALSDKGSSQRSGGSGGRATMEQGSALSELTERQQMIFDQIEDRRRSGRSTEEAVHGMKMLGLSPEVLEDVERVERFILARGREHQLLRIPGGMESLAYRVAETDR